MPRTPPFLNERLAEAARYALMRRLLPAIRHNIAGLLQPVGMLAAMLERRMTAVAPDLVQLGKSSQSLNTLSREAAATSLNLMNWLAPRDNNLVDVRSAVEESLGLMTTELSFRGFAVANKTTDVQMELPRGMLRSVFTASLIALTDRVEGAAKVVVTAGMTDTDGRIYLKLALESGGSPELLVQGERMQTYRSLDWDDVQALADAEGISLSYGDRCVQLFYSGVGNRPADA